MGRNTAHLTPIGKGRRQSGIQWRDVPDTDVQGIVVGVYAMHRRMQKHLFGSRRIIGDDNLTAPSPIGVMRIFPAALMLSD